jgi:hypothetical protein
MRGMFLAGYDANSIGAHMNGITKSADETATSRDRMFPILLMESLLLASGLVYYFWMSGTWL